MPSTFSCFLIGETTLPISCAEVLLEEGHSVRGVISADPDVTRWAHQRDIPRYDPGMDLAELLGREPFDYLFSVNNLRMLPAGVVTAPRRRAVNFHDGPLPAYAGLNTPVWALLRGERDYGISWHVITEGVDEGDVLEREPVEIAPDETALTLNAKCYEAAIRSFTRLVGALAARDAQGEAQDFSTRVYFGKNKRPAAACALRWERPARELDALVRALDFGDYPNPLGVPKVLLAGDAIAVSGLELAPERSGGAPGTVVAADGASITVTTATEDVRVTLARDAGLEEGAQLPIVEDAEALTAFHEDLARHEDFWTARLATLDPLVLPYARPAAGGEVRSHGFTVPHLDADADAVVAALLLYAGQLAGKDVFDVAYGDDALAAAVAGREHLAAGAVPLRVTADDGRPFADNRAAIGEELSAVRRRVSYMLDLADRDPRLAGTPSVAVVVAEQLGEAKLVTGSGLTMAVSADGGACRWLYDAEAIDDADIAGMERQFTTFLAAIERDGDRPLAELALLGDDELGRLVVEWNDTALEYPRDACIHELFREQVERTPDAVALVADDAELSYRELDRQSDRLARHLQGLGVGPDVRVGVHASRSARMVVGLLAILKAGGAYVPMDPAYPSKRIAFMIEDAEVPVLLASRDVVADLPEHGAEVVLLEDEPDCDDGPVACPATAGDLAYVIYTSGSTGKPKGVMVTHRNAVNFFAGMDERIEYDEPGVWLAETSISFDISVLELFWTLTRGFKVVVFTGREPEVRRVRRRAPATVRDIDFSLFYFAAGQGSGEGKYRLLMDGAKFADEHGFSAIWTPERHFHEFGGLYPNPSVISAAIAATTERLKIRAGSVVSPLHNPARIAEEWSIVDNLSGGRVGISFASGWQPNDFVLAPENFADRKDLMFRQIEIVKRLWRGDSIALPGPFGKDVEVSTLPRPIQPELPVWVTAAGNPETFRAAGEQGFAILTHLLGQTVEETGEKLAIYRAAWRAAGHPGDGHATLMLHTFVGDDVDEVREQVRAPMKEYLRSSVGLIQAAAWTFPTFKQATTGDDGKFTMENLSPEELDAVLDFSFERYFETSGLFGTPETCLRLVERLREIEVDEIACLIDFHTDADVVLAHLPKLDAVRAEATRPRPAAGAEVAVLQHPIAALIEEHGVTHFQCTPSMAGMLLAGPDGETAFRTLHQLLVGGEAFPVVLARQLRALVPGSIENVYGPTETTIWSSTFRLGSADGQRAEDSVLIGRPLANQRLYVLDRHRRPAPIGVPGELFIGGDGVTRGYLNRPELNDERFLADPFAGHGARLYRTGDLAVYRADGNVEFLGRMDNQVKLRGYRIELGEIEAVLADHPEVRETAVVARTDGPGGDPLLVAYLVSRNGSPPSAATLRGYAEERLPEYMVPAIFEVIDEMPRTPNGKLDRKALPAPAEKGAAEPAAFVAPRDDTERSLAELWERQLGVKPVGVRDSFFDLGGHSLLAVRLFGEIEKVFGKRLPLATLFDAPTIELLAEILREERSVPTWSSLVEIQPDGTKPPFFCVHAHGGHVLFYYDLARYLGSDQPLYGLQARGLDGSEAPLGSFEEMARSYIEEMRAVQPEGPYHLGGDCLGGVIAYEMAQQLQAAGQEVALVAMFDSFRPGWPKLRRGVPKPAYGLMHFAHKAGFHFGNVARLRGRERWSYLGDRARRAGFAVRSQAAKAVGKPSPLVRTQTSLSDAYDAYEPKPYDGRITMLRATRMPSGIEDAPDLGWGGLPSEGVEVHEMPVYFMTGIAEPNVQVLAKTLAGCLAAPAEPERGGGRLTIAAAG
jgi:natural product biosynthesis luciferase-like monooxygenase protein